MHNKNAKKFKEKKALIHRSPFWRKPLIYYFCDSWPLSVFRHNATFREKRKFSMSFLKLNFEKHFSQILVFEVFCKANKFSESWGWLLCYFWSYGTVEVSYWLQKLPPFSFFDSVRLSETFIWSTSNLCFHSRFRLEKKSFASCDSFRHLRIFS